MEAALLLEDIQERVVGLPHGGVARVQQFMSGNYAIKAKVK